MWAFFSRAAPPIRAGYSYNGALSRELIYAGNAPLAVYASGTLICPLTNDEANTLTYDAENRVVSSTDGSGTATYSYAGPGLRVAKTFSGTTTVYVLSHE